MSVRGRVLSLYMVALGVSYPIGSLLQGPLADSFGLTRTTAGAATLLAVALVATRVVRPRVLQALAATTPAEMPPVKA
jgi:predicted MFS family arabinose efflux permease